MYFAGMNSGVIDRFDASDAGPRFGPMKLAVAVIRGVLTLAMLSALMISAARVALAQTETVLYTFQGGTDGEDPGGNLTSDGAGNLYGTTLYGGLGYGTVYELSPNGVGGWSESVLYAFTGGADGAYPNYANVILDRAGNLYGTAQFGGTGIGSAGYGVVFELSPVGTSWKETVLYSFTGGSDGSYPGQNLIMDAAGNLYGVTPIIQGGSTQGTVFEVSPSEDGWTEQVIYEANGLGYSGLTWDGSGNIFGATYSTVFELSPNGSGGWNSTVIHTFTGSPKDGSYPEGALTFDKAGNLYGATQIGGAKKFGTVFKLTPVTQGKKKGTWTEKILYSFKGGKKDGSNPQAGVTVDGPGNVYGTTQEGVNNNPNGMVFELVAPVGTGSYKEKVLWNFDGTDGQYEQGGLLWDGVGDLYGTADQSGGAGLVFELTP